MTLLTLLAPSASTSSDAAVAAVRIWDRPEDETYIEGDLVRCFAEFRDPEDVGTDSKWVLIDPSTVTFRVVDPSGNVATSTPTRDSAGLYHADVNVDEAGTWTYGFAGTGTYQAAEERSFSARASAF